MIVVSLKAFPREGFSLIIETPGRCPSPGKITPYP
jgi:hypothetical protein